MINPDQLGIGTKLRMPFSDAVGRVKDALSREGFGILTEIDLQEVLKEKLGQDIGRYLILGACHPETALRAIRTTPEAGLLMPCNVIVFETEPGRVAVTAINPVVALAGLDRKELRAPAREVAERLEEAISSLPT